MQLPRLSLLDSIQLSTNNQPQGPINSFKSQNLYHLRSQPLSNIYNHPISKENGDVHPTTGDSVPIPYRSKDIDNNQPTQSNSPPSYNIFPSKSKSSPSFRISPSAPLKATRKRTRTTKEQAKALQILFDTNPLPNLKQRQELGDQIGMTPRSVQIWFQNKRQQMKRMNLSPSISASSRAKTTEPNSKTRVLIADTEYLSPKPSSPVEDLAAMALLGIREIR